MSSTCGRAPPPKPANLRSDTITTSCVVDSTNCLTSLLPEKRREVSPALIYVPPPPPNPPNGSCNKVDPWALEESKLGFLFFWCFYILAFF